MTQRYSPSEPQEALHSGDGDLHCLCGRLVARWVDGAIEIRCQRCKRTLRLVLNPQGTIHIQDGPGL